MSNKLKIGIIGGSLGGLFTGIALNAGGHDVAIFEKSGGELNDRGAGIVLQHELMDFLYEYDIADVKEINVPIFQRRYLNAAGNVVYKENTTQLMTSWATLYHRLKKHFPGGSYHYGHKFSSFTEHNEKIRVIFDNGYIDNFDLLIGADGINSSVRGQLYPHVKPEYAGYVGWRGIVEEDDIAASLVAEFEDRFTFFNMPDSHILCYLIPGNNNEITKGKRRLNWVWYWNVTPAEENNLLVDINGRYRPTFVPEGYVQEEFIQMQREIANRVMPPIFRDLISATRQPFLQPINDLAVERMFRGRVALIGDAAFAPRPHTAASTAKAVANSVSLASALSSDLPLEHLLLNWEKSQLQVGIALKNRGIDLGRNSNLGYL
jgi:2,6-dihydroxypyridine 3-monooxygenase